MVARHERPTGKLHHFGNVRRGAFALAVALACAAATFVSSAAAMADTNLLANGSFANGTAGWKVTNATLTIATDGNGDTAAGRVALNGTASSYQLFASPRPATTTTAGAMYTGGGLVRSDTPGKKVCLQLKVVTSGGAVVVTGGPAALPQAPAGRLSRRPRLPRSRAAIRSPTWCAGHPGRRRARASRSMTSRSRARPILRRQRCPAASPRRQSRRPVSTCPGRPPATLTSAAWPATTSTATAPRPRSPPSRAAPPAAIGHLGRAQPDAHLPGVSIRRRRKHVRSIGRQRAGDDAGRQPADRRPLAPG